MQGINAEPLTLEKHEIVKAKLSDQLKNDNKAMEKFCKIWEACSDMSFYIQQKLPNMTEIFGKDMSNFKLERFDDFPIAPQQLDNSFGMKTIEKLLDIPVKKEKEVSEIDYNDSFQPIIDFPNFLLIVLKITRMQEKDFNPSDFTLDDKELINEFDKVKLTPNLSSSLPITCYWQNIISTTTWCTT